MSPKSFLFFQILVVVGLIYLFFRGKKSSDPTPLNFKKHHDDMERGGNFRSTENPTHTTGSQNQQARDAAFESTLQGETRGLQVFFNFNGETFDADEILGLAAGSSVQAAQAAFQKQFSHLDSKDRLIFELALKSIQQQRGK